MAVNISRAFGLLLLLPGCSPRDVPPAPKSAPPISTIVVPDVYDGCERCARVVRQMAWSLDNEPRKWSFNGYRIWRDGGGAMWVANRADGISIGPTPHALGEVGDAGDRALLWRAFQRWLALATAQNFGGAR